MAEAEAEDVEAGGRGRGRLAMGDELGVEARLLIQEPPLLLIAMWLIARMPTMSMTRHSRRRTGMRSLASRQMMQGWM